MQAQERVRPGAERRAVGRPASPGRHQVRVLLPGGASCARAIAFSRSWGGAPGPSGAGPSDDRPPTARPCAPAAMPARALRGHRSGGTAFPSPPRPRRRWRPSRRCGPHGRRTTARRRRAPSPGCAARRRARVAPRPGRAGRVRSSGAVLSAIRAMGWEYASATAARLRPPDRLRPLRAPGTAVARGRPPAARPPTGPPGSARASVARRGLRSSRPPSRPAVADHPPAPISAARWNVATPACGDRVGDRRRDRPAGAPRGRPG